MSAYSPIVVDGHWSEWTEWSPCDAQCGGGVRQRNRTCSNPPPKNGGRECEGMTLQSQSCNTQPCTKDIGTQTGDWRAGPLYGTFNIESVFFSIQPVDNIPIFCCFFSGCLNNMVLVTEEDCRAGRVEPCPPTCSHLSSASNCTATCVPGKSSRT